MKYQLRTFKSALTSEILGFGINCKRIVLRNSFNPLHAELFSVECSVLLSILREVRSLTLQNFKLAFHREVGS